MSFKCNACKAQFEVDEVPTRVVTKVRPVEYVFGMNKTFLGKETVKEMSVCLGCSRSLSETGPEMVMMDKTKQVFCQEPKKKLPKDLDKERRY